MVVLGLDISTNSTGYAIIDESLELIKYGFIDTSKEDNWLMKASKFLDEIETIVEGQKIDHVAIEELLSKFSGGKSSAKTIISLARFNGLATFFIYQLTEKLPEHINVLRCRSLADCKVPRGINSKDFVLDKVISWYPSIVMPRMKRKDDIAKNAYDIADAVVVARARLKQLESDTHS
jgi:Holliday junction resolvasome RuvABC endonuclease subunit